MSCPDRLALFVGLEEDDPAVRAHLSQCERCRALAQQEELLSDALYRLRDPAPPAELLAGALRRVDEEALLARRARIQTTAILAGLAALLALCFGLAGPDHAIGSALDFFADLSAARTAAGALGRTIGSGLSRLLVPVAAAQAVALLLAALVFNRLAAAVRVRSES